MHHALSFPRDQHPRLVNSWPHFEWLRSYRTGEHVRVGRSRRDDRSRKLHLLYLLSFRKWNRANGTWYRLRLCRINYLSLSPGIDDTIVSDASNERHLLEALDLFSSVVHKLASACMHAGCAYRVLHLFSLSQADSVLELLAVRTVYWPRERIFPPTYFGNSKFWSPLSLISFWEELTKRFLRGIS